MTISYDINRYQFAILRALSIKHLHRNPPVYEGTVPEAEVARRRAANKLARRQRKVNSK